MGYPVRRPSYGRFGLDPLGELSALRSELNRMVGGVLAGLYGDRGWLGDVDLEQTDEGWTVTARLPGVAPEEVLVELDDRELCICSRSAEDEEEGGAVQRTRREFNYRLTLPGDVDPEAVDATMDHGLLTVRLPRSTRSRRRSVSVGRGAGPAVAGAGAAESAPGPVETGPTEAETAPAAAEFGPVETGPEDETATWSEAGGLVEAGSPGMAEGGPGEDTGVGPAAGPAETADEAGSPSATDATSTAGAASPDVTAGEGAVVDEQPGTTDYQAGETGAGEGSTVTEDETPAQTAVPPIAAEQGEPSWPETTLVDTTDRPAEGPGESGTATTTGETATGIGETGTATGTGEPEANWPEPPRPTAGL